MKLIYKALFLGGFLASSFVGYEFFLKKGVSSDIAYVSAAYHEIKSPFTGVLRTAPREPVASFLPHDIVFSVEPIEQEFSSHYVKIEEDIAIKALEQSEKDILDIQYQLEAEKQLHSQSLAKINYLNKELKREESLVKNKMIGQASLDFASNELAQEKFHFESISKKILSLESKIESYKKHRQALEMKIEQKNLLKQESIRKNQLESIRYDTPLTVVKTRHVIGDPVQKGDVLAVGFNQEDLSIDAYFPEEKITQFKSGQRVNVIILATDEQFDGVVSWISPVGGHALNILPPNYQSGHFLPLRYRFMVRIKLKNPPSYLRPGMSATVIIPNDRA